MLKHINSGDRSLHNRDKKYGHVIGKADTGLHRRNLWLFVIISDNCDLTIMGGLTCDMWSEVIFFHKVS